MKVSINFDADDYKAARALARKSGLPVSSFVRSRVFMPDISEIFYEFESTRSSITEAVQSDLIQLVQSLKKGTP